MKIMTDSPIRFPGLFGDWAITISSKAIDIGNGIYWYGILIALGMLLALWWCMRQRTKYGIRDDDLIAGLHQSADGQIDGLAAADGDQDIFLFIVQFKPAGQVVADLAAQFF